MGLGSQAMSIQILEAAPTTALTTLQTVKCSMGITATDRDETLVSLIQAASDFACRYCGRQFAFQKIREGLPGKGVPEILLSLTPIIEVESLYHRDSAMDNSSWLVIDDQAGIIQTTNGFHGSYFGTPFTIDAFPSSYAQEIYFAIYEGGYVLPGWDEATYGPRTLPYDLERAIIETVSFQHRTNASSGGSTGVVWDGVMQSYKIGDTSVSWGNKSSADMLGSDGGVSAFFPSSAIAVLNYYRRWY